MQLIYGVLAALLPNYFQGELYFREHPNAINWTRFLCKFLNRNWHVKRSNFHMEFFCLFFIQSPGWQERHNHINGPMIYQFHAKHFHIVYRNVRLICVPNWTNMQMICWWWASHKHFAQNFVSFFFLHRKLFFFSKCSHLIHAKDHRPLNAWFIHIFNRNQFREKKKRKIDSQRRTGEGKKEPKNISLWWHNWPLKFSNHFCLLLHSISLLHTAKMFVFKYQSIIRIVS